MQRCCKILSFLLVICMFFPAFAGVTSVSAEESQLPEPIAADLSADAEDFTLPEIVDAQEVIDYGYAARDRIAEATDLNSFVFLNSDGTSTLRLYDHPVKYIDETGTIQDITLTIEKHNDGYRTADNAIVTTFAQKLSDGITLTGEDVTVRMLPADCVLPESVSRLSSDNKKVSYPYDSKTSYEYSLTYTGFKEDIVVEEYTGQTEYVFRLYTNGLMLTERDGSYYLTDADGETKATVGDIIIFTADERNNTFGRMTHETVREHQEYLMTIHVDADYLRSEATVYPIRIDPTIEVTSGTGAIEDTTINSLRGSDGASGSLYLGKRETYGISRILMKFPGLNLSSVPSADSVTKASVKLRDLLCESEAHTVYCYAFTGNTWSESTANWSNVNPNSYATQLSTKSISYANGESIAHTYEFDITAAVKGWKNGTHNQNKGILFKSTSTVESASSYSSRTFGSYNRASYKPSLSVVYNQSVSTSIKLSSSSVRLPEHGLIQLAATVVPAGLPVTWSSQNTNIATVSSSGMVIAQHPGITKVSASVTDSSGKVHTAYCTVYANLSDGVYYLQNASSKYYMDAKNSGITNRTNVYQQSKFAPTENNLKQLWRIHYIADGYYTIRPMHKLNMALSNTSGNADLWRIGTTETASGTPSASRWTIEYTPQGYVIKNGGSNSTVLKIAETKVGGNIDVGTYVSSETGNRWNLERQASPPAGILLYDAQNRLTSATRYVAPDETRTLQSLGLETSVYSESTIDQSLTWSSSNTSVIRVERGTGTITGLTAGTATLTGTKTIKKDTYTIQITVKVTEIPNGTYFMQNKRTEKYVDIENQTMSDGTQIHQWSFHGGNTQKWVFQQTGDGYYTIRSANASTSYYLGVENDSTANDASVILRRGSITNGMKWKIEKTSRGSYKIVPKTGEANNRVLSVGVYVANIDGIDIQQRDYVNDDNYKDEWNILKGIDLALIALPEEYDRTSFFDSVVEDMAKIGYRDYYENQDTIKNGVTKEQLLNFMKFSKITVVRSHGSQNSISASDGRLTRAEILDLPQNVFAYSELIVYGACETGFGGEGSQNLVNATHEQGCDTVVGFRDTVWSGEVNIWCEGFFESLSNGATVEQACKDAEIFVFRNWFDNSLEMTTTLKHIAGDSKATFPKSQ